MQLPKNFSVNLAHSQKKAVRSTHIMQFVVEAAGVADGLAVLVPPPQRGLGRLAVGAGGPLAAGGALLLRGGK